MHTTASKNILQSLKPYKYMNFRFTISKINYSKSIYKQHTQI